ncbi:hypothetical protein [Nostoc sp.]
MGKLLPTEAEWKKAVSLNAQTNNRRTYSWEDEEATAQHCNCVVVDIA